MIKYSNTTIPELSGNTIRLMSPGLIGEFGYRLSPHYHQYKTSLSEFMSTRSIAESMLDVIENNVSLLKKETRINNKSFASKTILYSTFSFYEDLIFKFKIYLTYTNLNYKNNEVCPYLNDEYCRSEFETYDKENKCLYCNFHINCLSDTFGRSSNFLKEELDWLFYWYKYLTNYYSLENSLEVKNVQSFDMRYIRYKASSKYEKYVNEAFGVVDGIQRTVQSITSSIERKINSCEGKNIDMYFDFPTIDLPFKKIEFHFIYEYEDRNDMLRDGQYFPTNFIEADSIEIYVKVRGKYNPEEILEHAKSCLFHELTHAYEDYKLQLKGDSLTNKMENSFYGIWTYFLTNKDKLDRKSLIYVYSLYRTDPDEVNAILAQLGSEVKDVIHKYFKNHVIKLQYSFNEKQDLIKYAINNLQSYKHMNILHSLVEEIEEFSDEDVDKICKNLTNVLKDDEFTKQEFYKFKKVMLLNWHNYQKRFYRNFHNILHSEIDSLDIDKITRKQK